MTLLINSNKDFDWVETPCLFYFRSVKFHYVKETHMMFIAFCLTLVKIVVVVVFRTKDNQTNFFHDLLTIWKHWLGLESARAALCKWTTRTRQTAFQKLLQSSQTSRNNKKLSKQVLVMINHILANSQINSIPE